ncbi:hypothetical protein LCM4576_21765 [Mesorhizobium sp. LCM 4576]|uniref:hypothetical protein n=1 Tax=Mesorhizobium sp. LCM 4576 TaxID=1848289 RepID=UPI0008DAE688|nr:hypothetical protein [Mesorhizobium sp. LCM 4576]OHV69676.1 hypothetical protein LCM4576_21765 [Mesorhizobium sp. LCM 4576]
MGQAAGPGAAAHRLALGATQWLEDDHIAADYAAHGGELHRANSDIAARTRLVEPPVARPLRLALDAADAADALRGVLGDGRADFVFLPVNNA